MLSGRLFQSLGAKYEKVLPPLVDFAILGTTNGAFPLHGTVRYGSVWFTFFFFFHWVLYLVPGTFLVPPPSDLYRYQNVTCKLYWSLIGRRKSSLLRHWTCDTRLNIDPLDLNQHRQRRIGRNFCLNKRTFLHQPKKLLFRDLLRKYLMFLVPLVDRRGADLARAWWGDAEWKSLMYILFCTLYIFRVCFLFIFLPLYLCFASIKNNLIE